MRKDGSRFWANVVIDPIRDSDGRLIGFAKVTRDITHRIEAERELERARQELFQAQKMESLGHLTGGVAHDFNNLLTVIIGSLGLLKKRLPGDQRTADLLQNALEAAQRGANLTQRMLSFARKQRLDPQPCAIPDLLRGMTDLLIHSLGPSVSIETRFPLDLDLGLTDANQLELSIINLATNARDAMPNGGRIVFSASNQRVPADNPHRLAPGNYICLSISDTGSGMDEETLRRAVEPFYTTKGWGVAPGWACRSSTASPSSSAAGSPWRASRASAPPRTSGYPPSREPRKAPVRAMARRRRRPAKASGCACPVEYWWWTTTRWC